MPLVVPALDAALDARLCALVALIWLILGSVPAFGGHFTAVLGPLRRGAHL